MTEHLAFSNWLAGFIDGEGCFVLQIKGGNTFAIRFRIRLRQDDEAILHDIQRFIGYGKVYREKDYGAAGCPISFYEISSVKGCLALIEILKDAPMRAKKRRDFDIWREAAEHMHSTPYGKGRDRGLMFRCAADLKDNRLFRQTDETISR